MRVRDDLTRADPRERAIVVAPKTASVMTVYAAKLPTSGTAGTAPSSVPAKTMRPGRSRPRSLQAAS
jgi:hypothetical protein